MIPLGADPADDHRLHDAVGADRGREAVEPGLVEVLPRLELARLELIDVELQRRARRRRDGRLRNQGAQAFAECETLFHDGFLGSGGGLIDAPGDHFVREREVGLGAA